MVELISKGSECYVMVSYSGGDAGRLLGGIKVSEMQGGDAEDTMHENRVFEGDLRDCGSPHLLQAMLVCKCYMS